MPVASASAPAPAAISIAAISGDAANSGVSPSVGAVNLEGNVPLHRNYQAALLAPGVNVRNVAGLTPLHYAALAGNTQGIEWLLAKGADPNARTRAATHWRAGYMSKAFGPGIPVAAASRPLDLARMRRAQTRFNTSNYDEPVKVLERATR